MHRWLAAAGALVVLAIAPPSRAADDDAVLRAEEIVVEEQAPPPLRVFEDTPVETEVLDREAIERRPGTTAADLVSTLPGLRQQERVQGEKAAVSIEGLPPEFTRALVDGNRYEGEIGGVDDFRSLPLADAERVEVLRGAQSLRYGPDAAGGVVRIDTVTPPSDGLRARFDGGYGSDHWLYTTASVGYGNEQVGGWLRFVNDQIRGFEAPDDVDDAVLVSAGSGSRRIARDVYGKLRFDPSEALQLVTRFGWRSDDESGLLPEARDPGDREEKRWLAGQDFDVTLGPATHLAGWLSWYDDQLSSDAGRPFELAEDEVSTRVMLDHVLETGSVTHALTFGFDGFRPRLDLREGSAPLVSGDEGSAPAALEEHLAYGGVFAITESQLVSWLTLEGGLRAQLHRRYSPEFLPQVALLLTPWQPDEVRFARLRVQWGLGSRTPSLRDLYQPAVPQLGGVYFLAGNPELDPEHVRSSRVGVEAVPIESVSLSLTAFYNQLEDHIRSTAAGVIPIGTERVPPPPLTPELEALCELTGNALPECSREPVEVPINATLFRKTNLDSVTTRGIEARVRVQPHPLLRLELAYTLLDTHVVDANTTLEELPNEPRNVVDLNAALEVPRAGTRVNAFARWRGKALTETSGTGLLGFGTPEYSKPSLVLDLRVVQPIGERFALYADVFNVTDERVVDSYVVRGRTFFLGVRGSFD